MDVKDIELLFDYSYWANEQVMEVLERLSPDEITREIGGAYGSIRNTLVHMVSVEWGWTGRCGGLPRKERLKPDDFPNLDAIKETWTNVEQSVRHLISNLSNDDLRRVVAYTNDRNQALSMPLGELMHHAYNHNVHHRGQINLMLRMLGHKPIDVDILYYYGQKRGVAAW